MALLNEKGARMKGKEEKKRRWGSSDERRKKEVFDLCWEKRLDIKKTTLPFCHK